MKWALYGIIVASFTLAGPGVPRAGAETQQRR